jgi:hypothetical protein
MVRLRIGIWSPVTRGAEPHMLAGMALAAQTHELRDRFEAAGASVLFSPTPAGPGLIAERETANMEPASG